MDTPAGCLCWLVSSDVEFLPAGASSSGVQGHKGGEGRQVYELQVSKQPEAHAGSISVIVDVMPGLGEAPFRRGYCYVPSVRVPSGCLSHAMRSPERTSLCCSPKSYSGFAACILLVVSSCRLSHITCSPEWANLWWSFKATLGLAVPLVSESFRPLSYTVCAPLISTPCTQGCGGHRR